MEYGVAEEALFGGPPRSFAMDCWTEMPTRQTNKLLAT